MKFSIYILFSVLFSILFGTMPLNRENLVIKEVSDDKIKLSFKEISSDVVKGLSGDDVSDLAISAGLIALEDGINYSISYNVLSYSVVEDFVPSSYFDIEEKLFLSEQMSFRGVPIANLVFYPYSYDEENNVLKVFNDVDIDIDYIDSPNTVYSEREISLSEDFLTLVKSHILNPSSLSREAGGIPSIIFICGGNSLSNSYVQDLLQWRERQGYEVIIGETSDIGTSTSSIKQFIQGVYNSSDSPPEHIVLFGDVSGTYQVPNYSNNGGSSDFDYTLLDGGDLLPEMTIGRISANSSSDLANIINKTIAYEKATYFEYIDSGWYERAALVGDPSATGNSAVITNEYVQNILINHGFEDVELRSNSPFSNWMEDQLENGILYFNYRGYIGTSGFGSGNINSANNGYMNPFATFITCATGDFSWTSISEDFVRAGSVSNPKGAVAAVGTSTSSTHTVPNNIVDMGIYDGIFAKGLSTAGYALVSGKLALHNTYPTNPSSLVTKFSHWNNLIGDPAVHLWTDTPQYLDVSHDLSINSGTDYMSIDVTDQSGNAIEGAWVTLLQHGEGISMSILTDDSGQASFNFTESNLDDISIVVRKRNYIPYVSEIFINDDVLVQIDGNLQVDDGGDGVINPGESIDLYLNIGSDYDGDFGPTTFTLSSVSDKVIFTNNIINYPNFTTNQQVGPFSLDVLDDLNNEEELNFVLEFSAGDLVWNFSLFPALEAPFIKISQLNFTQTPFPNSSSGINITLENTGSQSLYNSSVQIVSHNPEIFIDNISLDLPEIQPGSQISTIIPIDIEFSENIINGSVFTVDVLVNSSSGYGQAMPHNITVGVVGPGDPLGPDSHGYYIYDSSDFGYSLMPFYDWIEIDPAQGGQGTDLGISDAGNGNNISNSTKYVDLPFTFTFYGQDYNEISVNANGWISFGHSNMESFRNYQLPGPGGPSPMVAVFWDDLKTNNSSKVFKYVEEDHVIIEWSNMLTYDNSSLETFQIILYDSFTPTGDDDMKLQYKVFNNTSVGDYSQYTPYHGCYSTVGIENHLGNVGLEYTFDNQYPTAATPIQNETALFITTRGTSVLMTGDVNQDQVVNILDIILVINHILNIENIDNLEQYIADTTGDGNINILDVIIMIGLILDS